MSILKDLATYEHDLSESICSKLAEIGEKRVLSDTARLRAVRVRRHLQNIVDALQDSFNRSYDSEAKVRIAATLSQFQEELEVFDAWDAYRKEFFGVGMSNADA